jgi:hypothetical protein
MQKHKFLVAQVAISGAFAGFLVLASWTTPAAAQGSAFCPAGFSLSNGFCVSPAFAAKPVCPKDYGPVSFGTTFACVGNSSSAAASQSLNTTTRAISDQSMYSTLDAVRSRRDEESRQCPAGSQRINGVCTPTSGGRAIGYAPEESYAADLRPGRLLVKSTPTAAAPSAVQTAIWMQAFGDHERRNEITPNSTPTLGSIAGTLLPPGGLSTSTDLSRSTWTAGVIAGFDFTYRNVFSSSDALVVGALAGYTTSRVTFKSTNNITDLTGPSAGVFAAYASGAWSTDVTFKTDFMTQDQQFSDFTGDIFAVSGSSSIRLNNYALAGNLNYKFPVGTNWYIEPTVGASYTDTVYGTGAAALGLADTNSTRVQGGARVGTNWTWGTVSVTSNVAGLAYSTISITGGSAGGAFSGAGVVQTDEGKVFGQVLYAANFDFGHGASASFGTDVRFGNGVLGVGAKGGLRYQW